MTTLPAPYYAKVSRSPVTTTEDQTASGLHVVRNVDAEDVKVHRGVIMALGAKVSDEFPDLDTGYVLFYLDAIRLGDHDFVLVHYDNVIAWEA